MDAVRVCCECGHAVQMYVVENLRGGRGGVVCKSASTSSLRNHSGAVVRLRARRDRSSRHSFTRCCGSPSVEARARSWRVLITSAGTAGRIHTTKMQLRTSDDIDQLHESAPRTSTLSALRITNTQWLSNRLLAYVLPLNALRGGETVR